MRDVILIQGFGCSGSSVLIDFFNELSSCYSLNTEFDLLRFSGGLFELEKLLPMKNLTITDSILKRFLKLINYLYSNTTDEIEGRNFKELIGEDFEKISLNFFDSLVDFKINIDRRIYNLHEYNQCRVAISNYFPKESFKNQVALFLLNLAMKMTKTDFLLTGEQYTKILTDYDNIIYYAKNLTADDFIVMAKNYLEKILNLLPKSKYLVLDQTLNLKDNDIDHQLKYFDNAKVIFMPRDPRDTFISMVKPFRKWVSQENANEFIKAYKHRYSAYPIKHSNVMNIYFEDFVSKFKDIAPKVLEFCSIDEDLPASFNIEHSSENIGVWKTYKDQELMDYIKQKLPEYCWNN